MFSGIIEEIGTVKSYDGETLTVRANRVLEDLEISQSIMIAGACLTIVAISKSSYVHCGDNTRNARSNELQGTNSG